MCGAKLALVWLQLFWLTMLRWFKTHHRKTAAKQKAARHSFNLFADTDARKPNGTLFLWRVESVWFFFSFPLSCDCTIREFRTNFFPLSAFHKMNPIVCSQIKLHCAVKSVPVPHCSLVIYSRLRTYDWMLRKPLLTKLHTFQFRLIGVFRCNFAKPTANETKKKRWKIDSKFIFSVSGERFELRPFTG